MMAVTPLQTLLKQAGPNVVSPEQIRELNQMLQKVHK